jgi:hypothetical protein
MDRKRWVWELRRPGRGQHDLPASSCCRCWPHTPIDAGLGKAVIAALSLAMVFARLSAIIPGAGGPMLIAREAFGDFAGYLRAWCYWKSA